jgi:hypothetical protein
VVRAAVVENYLKGKSGDSGGRVPEGMIDDDELRISQIFRMLFLSASAISPRCLRLSGLREPTRRGSTSQSE